MEAWLAVAVALVAVGLFAGVLAGMFGIGGGIVTVPALEAATGLLGVDAAIRMHIAVGTSLAVIIPTSIASAIAHYRRGAVDLDVTYRWSLFVAFGALMGAWMASLVDSRFLAFLFAILAFAMAIKLIFYPEYRNLTVEIPRSPWVPVIPIAIGKFSAMMGVGGGTFSVIALTLFNFPIHRAIGTAALLGLFISLPGAIGFVAAGSGDVRLPPGNIGFVSLAAFALITPATMIAAPLGVKIAHTFSERRLSILFGFISIIASFRLFYRALSW